jgi:hypothetical protein
MRGLEHNFPGENVPLSHRSKRDVDTHCLMHYEYRCWVSVIFGKGNTRKNDIARS